MNGITIKVIGGVLLMLVSFLIGQATLGSRVTVLETSYIHIKENMQRIHEKVDKLLERD